MIERVVEVEGSGRHLSRSRGFMVVSSGGSELGRIPLDDIAVVLVHGHGNTYSNNLLVSISERAIPLIVCDQKHFPVGWFLPIEANHLQAGRLRLQMASSRPLQKQVWRSLVKGKIVMQESLLALRGRPDPVLRRMARTVRSGDSENLEAQAARRYWRILFGADFRRDRNLPGENALLNYGYTILRSCVARSVLKSGLNPSLGFYHRRGTNAFALVDDIMEPLRPVVDRFVRQMVDQGVAEVSSEAKRKLASVLIFDIETAHGRSPVARCADRLAYSVVASLEQKKALLDLPLSFRKPAAVRHSLAESDVA